MDDIEHVALQTFQFMTSIYVKHDNALSISNLLNRSFGVVSL